MTQTPPTHGQPGQRTLAAILFTDVVGFSARVQRDEATTLVLLQQDFDAMRNVCEAHQGSVLKSTGDGLLMTFSSAVHAVACSLAMQRQFAAVAKSPGGPEPLQHRIGIHLGDVLIQNQDVMGDGVNIAARLQAEAEPGGICISQTVYDVVKNKLELHVLSLGARDLKNIAETIPVYRLMMGPPEAGKLGRGSVDSPRPRRLGVGLGVAAVVLMGVAGATAWWLSRPSGAEMAMPAPVTGESVAVLPTGEPVMAPLTTAVVTPAAKAAQTTESMDVDQQLEARLDAVEQLRAQYLDQYDFEGLARAVREKKDGPAGRISQLPNVAHSIEQLETMLDWVFVSLRKYSRQRPLTVSDGSLDPARLKKLFLAPDKRFIVLDDSATSARSLSELKPDELGAIIVALIWQSKPPAPRDVVVGAMAYAKLYSLPKMQEVLQRIRPRMGGK